MGNHSRVEDWPILAVPGEPGGEVIDLQLSDIIIRHDWQARAGLDEQAIRRYTASYEIGAEMPPLLVARVGPEGQGYALLGGRHRLEALRNAGLRSAPCRVIDGVGEHEAPWIAAQDNLRHGVPLKTREMRPVLGAYVRAGAHRYSGGRGRVTGRRDFKGFREIAKELGGVAPNTIRSWMQADFPGIARIIAGGAMYGEAWEPPVVSPEERSMAESKRSAEEAAGKIAAIKAQWLATDDPVYRREVARAVFALAEAVRGAGLYEPEEPDMEGPADF